MSYGERDGLRTNTNRLVIASKNSIFRSSENDAAARVERVVGYADRLPLSPDDPLDPANRRIGILVLKEPEPVKNAAATAESNPVVTAHAAFH